MCVHCEPKYTSRNSTLNKSSALVHRRWNRMNRSSIQQTDIPTGRPEQNWDPGLLDSCICTICSIASTGCRFNTKCKQMNHHYHYCKRQHNDLKYRKNTNKQNRFKQSQINLLHWLKEVLLVLLKTKSFTGMYFYFCMYTSFWFRWYQLCYLRGEILLLRSLEWYCVLYSLRGYQFPELYRVTVMMMIRCPGHTLVAAEADYWPSQMNDRFL